jgi:hypothetical protein
MFVYHNGTRIISFVVKQIGAKQKCCFALCLNYLFITDENNLTANLAGKFSKILGEQEQ